MIDKIQAIFDAYPNLSTDYLSLFNTITEYKTTFTTSLATYKTKREGYQAEYNGNCVTTTTTTTGATRATGATTTTTTGATTKTPVAGKEISTQPKTVSNTQPATDQTTTPYTLKTTSTGKVITSNPKTTF